MSQKSQEKERTVTELIEGRRYLVMNDNYIEFIQKTGRYTHGFSKEENGQLWYCWFCLNGCLKHNFRQVINRLNWYKTTKELLEQGYYFLDVTDWGKEKVREYAEKYMLVQRI